MAILRIPDGQGGYVTVPAIKGDKGDAGASSWAEITGKPTVFTPATHSHSIGDVNGLLARFGPGNSTTPKASGSWSVAVGSGASAAGQQAAALGVSASAGGIYDVALGNFASAGGGWSTALGSSTSAGGTASTALGRSAKASADYAQAITAYSTATKARHTVIGVDATDENIPTDIPGTVVIGKTGVPVYLAGRDVLNELETVDSAVKETHARIDTRPAFYSGPGDPPATIPGARVGDYWLDTTTMTLHKITGV